MKRDIAVKRMIQAVACGFGLLGLFAVSMGVCFAVDGIRNSDRSLLFFMPPFFLALGGIGIAIAWQALRRFGPTAIRNVVGPFLYLTWSQLAWFPESWQHGEPRWHSDWLDVVIGSGSCTLHYCCTEYSAQDLFT